MFSLLLSTALFLPGPEGVCTQLRSAGIYSVWALACQDSSPGGHAGVGVVSLPGAPLTLSTTATAACSEFLQIGAFHWGNFVTW